MTQPQSSPRLALTALCLTVLLPSLGTSSANVALPAIAEAFGAPFQAVQWVVLAYLLAITILVVGAGRLGDMAGRRKVLLAGMVLFTTASLLAGLAPSLWLLVAARAVQGVGAAAMMALAMAFVADTMPKERIGRAMGLLGAMSAVGTALGPSLGGLLIAGFGWRAVFLAYAPLGLAALLLALHHLPPDSRKSRREGPAAPLLQMGLLRDAQLRGRLAASFLVSAVLMATLVVGPFHLMETLHLAPATAGLILSAGPLVAALAAVPSGRPVDRFGTTRTSLAGLAAIAAGSVAIAALPPTLANYIAPIVIITAGYALFQAANNTAVMADAGAERRGVVSALLNLSRNLGLVIGASAMAALFAAAGLRATFAAAALLIAFAALSLRTPRARRSAASDAPGPHPAADARAATR
jgi:MFS family permease